MLDSDDNVAIIDYFDILPVEDICIVIILDLSYWYEVAVFEAVEGMDFFVWS